MTLAHAPWELWDATTRTVVAVGSLSSCQLAGFELKDAEDTALIEPHDLIVRPRRRPGELAAR